MFKSIVVAFDGSAHASRALETAAKLAAREQATLGIVNVIDADHMNLPMEIRKMGEIEHIIDPMPNLLVDFENAPPDLANNMARSSVDSQRAMLQYAEFIVAQARKQAMSFGATEVEVRIVTGDPAEGVVDFASEHNADLIVCGSRGLGRMKKLLLGSTSHKIAQLAECSCLTIK